MKRLAISTAVVLAALAGLAAVWQLREAVVIFFLSLGVAAAIRPAADRLAPLGVPRTFALAGAYLVALAALAGAIVLLIGPLMQELQLAGEDLVSFYEKIAREWPGQTGLEGFIGRKLPSVETFSADLATTGGLAVWQAMLGLTFSLFGLCATLGVIVILSLYWSLDHVSFERLWLSLLPVEKRIRARELWREIDAELGSYMRSEFVQSLAIGTILAITYTLLGVRYPLILALIGTLGWLLPWVGMFFTVGAVFLLSFPAAILTDSPEMMWLTTPAAAGMTLVILLSFEFAVEPRLFNRRRYNALFTALIVLAMAFHHGILGLIIGPPIAVALQVVGAALLQRRETVPLPTVELPGHTLTERATALENILAQVENPAPELMSLVSRLKSLVDQAQPVLPDSETAELATVAPQ
jgi:predicted PurR-regulated permease PerM